MIEFEQLYEELKVIAHRQLARHVSHTLNTTGLVHEAYLKLAQHPAPQDRAHLINTVTRAMRQILLDAARARVASKRGDGALCIELADAQAQGVSDPAAAPIELLAFDEALNQLSSKHGRMGRALELAFYGGVEPAEIAQLLDVNLRTVQRDLLAARTLVLAALRD